LSIPLEALALAILEAATLECKKREVDTPELRAALDLLEAHIKPSWLIPQFRHNLDGEQEHDYPALAVDLSVRD